MRLPSRLLSDCAGNEAKVLEDPSFKEICGSSHPHDLIDLPANLTVGAEHLRDSRLRSPTDKRIAQLAHHAFHCGVMDVGVRTIEIAEGLLQATIA